MSKPIAITDQDFDAEVLKSTTPVLVDFWAEWCGPCRMVAPILDELAEELGASIKIVKLNIDQNPNVPSAMGVTSIPTMVLFKDGKPLAMKAGAMPKSAFKAWIESVL